MNEEKANARYLNFPVQLLEGFMIDSKKVLHNIMDYAVYAHSEDNLEHGDDEERFKASAKYFKIKFGNFGQAYENGEILYNSLGAGNPMVGIDSTMLFDYYKNYKTDFQKVCLLGYLGLRSILLNKPYCKITNDNWLSRMDGKAKKHAKHDISADIQKYHTEYQTKKIKNELALNWNLVTYSHYTRGFYVSFKLTLDQLVFQVEKKRKAYKENQLKIATQEARKKALAKLKNKPE